MTALELAKPRPGRSGTQRYEASLGRLIGMGEYYLALFLRNDVVRLGDLSKRHTTQRDVTIHRQGFT